MTREQVIKGLECHSDPAYGCDACPYSATDGDDDCGWRELCKDALTLLKEQEAKPYGGFMAWNMVTAPQQVAYAAVTEKLIKCGVLKVQIENSPTGTVCNWAIKAVKWE